MCKKIYLVIASFVILTGLFVLVSGILWGAAFYIVWGIILLGIGVWQLLSRMGGVLEGRSPSPQNLPPHARNIYPYLGEGDNGGEGVSDWTEKPKN